MQKACALTAPRSVVITGASRGLGLASAAHLYKLGWRVVAAMRSVDTGLERLHAETGARTNDRRLLGVQQVTLQNEGRCTRACLPLGGFGCGLEPWRKRRRGC